MSPWLQSLIQGVLGVGCIVVAFTLLQGAEAEAARTAVSGFGFGLLGNLLKGPNQITLAEAEKLRGPSTPPPSTK